MAVRQRTIFKDNKYGVKIPRNIAEVYDFDTENGNSFWRDAIRKKMKGISPSFDVLDEGANPPPQ